MSQAVAEDREILGKFPTTLYRTPVYLEEPSSEALSQNTATVIEGLRNQLDTTVFRLLVTAQSEEQFKELVVELFPEYVEMSGAISTVVRVLDDSIARADEAFAVIKDCLVSDTWLLAGEDGRRDEAIFCLDTLHRAHFLSQDVAEYIKQGALASDCRWYQAAISEEWWSLLHLRCILFAIEHKIHPTAPVFLCLMDGFRHSVLSYGFARAAMDAKCQSDYSQIDFSSLEPDAEDEYLARGADKEYLFVTRQLQEPLCHRA